MSPLRERGLCVGELFERFLVMNALDCRFEARNDLDCFLRDDGFLEEHLFLRSED
jgi:hypothetical protein